MAKLLDGKQVAAAMAARLRDKAAELAKKNIIPTLAVIRVGERGGDVAYERGAVKRCETAGVEVRRFVLPQNVSQGELIKLIESVNNDDKIHGCLLFRPLPEQIDDRAVRNALSPTKDVDGITDASLGGVFAGTNTGFPPCTAKACMEILDFYGYNPLGKTAAVIGRSLVVGKPAAMMLMERNATVTVCHTKTADMPSVCRAAEILIVAAGRAGAAGKDCFSSGQVVIDVGINVDENGNMCGDADFEAANSIVSAITPVPGGVGAVTTSVLVKHVIEAACAAGCKFE